MITNLMYPHPCRAHWPESAAALPALGFAEAFTRCLPPPSNQLTLPKDTHPTRSLPGNLGCAVGIPAISSLPPLNSFDIVPWRHLFSVSSNGNFSGSAVTEQSDFSGKNHSSAFAVQKTGFSACQARSEIHPAVFIS